MRVSCYLIINRNGSLRANKTGTGIGSNELAIKCNVDVPESFFKRPQPVINITLDRVDMIDTDVAIDIVAPEIANAFNVSIDNVRDGLIEMLAKEQAE